MIGNSANSFAVSCLGPTLAAMPAAVLTGPQAFEGLSAALRLLRERSGLSQVALQKAAKLGASTVSDWERGVSAPHVDSIAALLSAMGLGLHDLARALDEVNGRAPQLQRGRPNARWVAAMTGRILDEDLVFGLAGGWLDPGDAQAREDFVASVETVASELARRVVSEVDRSGGSPK